MLTADATRLVDGYRAKHGHWPARFILGTVQWDELQGLVHQYGMPSCGSSAIVRLYTLPALLDSGRADFLMVVGREGKMGLLGVYPREGAVSQETLGKIEAFVERHPGVEYGPAHIVLDDCNVEDHHLREVIGKIEVAPGGSTGGH